MNWLRRHKMVCAALVLLGLLALSPTVLQAIARSMPYPVERLAAARERTESGIITDRHHQVLRVSLGREQTWMLWRDCEQISATLAQATVAVEDQRFYAHQGVDYRAIARAIVSNLRARRRVSGASTITMQLVRLAEPRPRNWTSKLIEGWLALRLDATLTKEEILTWYLNLAPYGGNIVGAEAASQRYFAKPAGELTMGEAALLAGLPQSPTRYQPIRHPERAARRRETVLRRMLAQSMITPTAHELASTEPLPERQHGFPFRAPHATTWLLRQFPAQRQLVSTLDLHLQSTAETILAETIRGLAADGVTHGAVVIIDHEASALRAMVGSPAFFNPQHHGQVNGALIPRSPGSTLKPLIYAHAVERGLLVPESVLADIPRRFGSYEPTNFGGHYAGPVTARHALADSLNLPAVNLVRRLGLESTMQMLRQTGFRRLEQMPGDAGLGIAVGGTQATLLELAQAYAMLGRLGRHRPLRVLESQPTMPGHEVVSEGAAWLVLEMLSDVERLRAPDLYDAVGHAPRMAWKTGTSYGHHDAWTLASTPDYTVAVWLGNADMTPARVLVGRHAASPPALRIMAAIVDRSAPWYERPPSVIPHEVCADSGDCPTAACPVRRPTWALAGAEPLTHCTVHVRLRIDAKSGERRCDACATGKATRWSAVEQWPPAMDAWLRVHQPGRPLIPQHAADCGHAIERDQAPRILSPADGTRLLAGANGMARVELCAHSDVDRLHWFINGNALDSTAAGERIRHWLPIGRHRITCSDDAGVTSQVVVLVLEKLGLQ